MKNLFDFILSIIALPFVVVVSAFCCLAIRLETPGNPVFSQIRVGKNQNLFTLYKLRSMQADTGDHASHEVSSSKITRVGGFLRKTKLDELPQVINVLLGQMSFVGPRPCLPHQKELIENRQRLGVFTMRPGITGPAQLAYIDMSTPKKLAKFESDYVNKYSFAADLRCILSTLTGRGSGDAAKK